MSGSGQTMFRGFGADYGPYFDVDAHQEGAQHDGTITNQEGTGNNGSYQLSTPSAQAINQPTAGGGFDWQGMTTGFGKGLLDLFRGAGGASQYPPGYMPPQAAPAVPIWVWVAVPVALVGVIALVRSRSSGRKSRR